MANKVYWFNLPTEIKAKVEGLKGTLTCLDDPTVDVALADITWFTLPEKVEALIAVANTQLAGADYDPGKKLRFFNLPKEVEAFFDFLDAASCV